MKKGDTWMPLYVGDYLADTMHLTGPDHGAYLLLLMHSWRTGPLRDDERALAAVARTDLATFREMWPTLREFFVPQEGTPGLLISHRLERERERAAQHIDQRSAAGKASAAARARQRESNGRSTSVAAPLEREGRPSPSPSPFPYPTDKGAADAASADRPLADNPWQDGLTLLRGLTEKPDGSCRKFFGRLRKAAGNDDTLVLACIRDAVTVAPADPEAWLMAAVKARQAPLAPTPMAPPTEVNGCVTAAVLERLMDELDVGNTKFPDLASVVVALLREGRGPDELYDTARALRRRGSVETMKTAAYLAAAVRNRARDAAPDLFAFNDDGAP